MLWDFFYVVFTDTKANNCQDKTPQISKRVENNKTDVSISIFFPRLGGVCSFLRTIVSFLQWLYIQNG